MRFDDQSVPIRTILLMIAVMCSHVGCSRNGSGPKVAIQVVAATYGGNCGASHGNVTDRLVAACNEKTTCKYTVRVETLGDTAPGCAKDYIAEWSCDDSPVVKRAKSVVKPEDHNEAGFGSIVTLTCDAPP
jgi:hypothetical protein